MLLGSSRPHRVVQRLAVRRQASVEQQPRRDRRRPAHRGKVALGQLELVGRLGRHRGAIAEDVTQLVRVEEAELVLLVRLPRDAAVDVGLDDERVGLLREIGLVGPLRRVARVQVEVQAREIRVVHLPARRREEPELVANDRPANRSVDVVRLLERVDLRQPARAQIVGEVVGLERRVRRPSRRRSP